MFGCLEIYLKLSMLIDVMRMIFLHVLRPFAGWLRRDLRPGAPNEWTALFHNLLDV